MLPTTAEFRNNINTYVSISRGKKVGGAPDNNESEFAHLHKQKVRSRQPKDEESAFLENSGVCAVLTLHDADLPASDSFGKQARSVRQVFLYVLHGGRWGKYAWKSGLLSCSSSCCQTAENPGIPNGENRHFNSAIRASWRLILKENLTYVLYIV